MKKLLAISFICALSIAAFGQTSSNLFLQFITSGKITNAKVKEFYNRLDNQMVWMQKENEFRRNILLNDLEHASYLGLEKKDYQFDSIKSICNRVTPMRSRKDSMGADILISNAAIHFYNDVGNGNTMPDFEYKGLKYLSNFDDIPALLADHISKGELASVVDHLSPALPEISAIQSKIKWFNVVIKDSIFSEEIITSNKVNADNKPLTRKLYQLGIIDSKDNGICDSTLKEKVKEAQRQFSLFDNGILETTTIGQLNISLILRLQQLKLSLNYYRWLNAFTQNQSVIVVNIPAAYLKVYQKNNVILEMLAIVGKKTTPTPTLTSVVNEAVLYPYWHVPYSIATKDLLPIIKQDPGFIDAYNFQVLDKAGEIVDPYSVNWHALSTKYFPYTLRQSAGCDNALGLLKLNFYSPFGVYLHDTPFKFLFMLNRRFLSPGCMRIEKAIELGHLVLKNNPIAIDTLEQKGCLRNQSPITVPASEHLPIIVWYNPAGVDSTGRVLFYEDVYEKFDWMKMKK